MERITYPVDRDGARKGVLFFLALAIGFLLFHVHLAPLLTEGADPSPVSRAIASGAGLVGFAFSSILVIAYLRRLLSDEPYLALDSRGVYDNASGTWSGAGWIEWSEIADIRVSTYHNLPCVEIVPKDRARFLKRFGWLGRLDRSERLGLPAVALRGPLLPVEPIVLADRMRAYWRSATDR